MTTKIACPRCGQMVHPQDRGCPHCGVALGFAAAMFEHAVASAITIDSTTPVTPEILVPRLGEYLIERGVLTQQQLQQALNHSREKGTHGERRLVGQALLELGLVDRETLDQVVTEQILQLQNALQQSNLLLEQRVRDRTRELQSALDKISELNQLKSNFIANVSHELRTPLTHIKGYLDLLSVKSLGPLSADQANAVEVMLRSENRLELLIEDLIQFSLASSGTFSVLKEHVNLIDLLQMILSSIKDKAQQKSIQLKTHIPNHTLVVNVDADKLRYALIELLDNAVKFTPLGGVIAVNLVSEDNLVCVTIQDTGIGIAPNRLSEIFEPFHQLDGSVTRRYGGVGLGLSLVKKIIEAHGSVIEIFSIEGKGSRFQFRLPLVS
jgi:signal transduction histidine kinase